MRSSLVIRVILLAICLGSACASQAADKPPSTVKAFKKLLEDRIACIWYAALFAHKDELPVGTVRLHVTFSREGRVLQADVVSNTSNDLAAQLAIIAVEQAKVPPIPTEVLTQGRFEFEPNFTIYPN
jgi:hypothetical protein